MIHRILSFIIALAMRVLDVIVERIPGFIRPNHLTHARWVLTLPVAVFANLDYPWLAVSTLILSSACDILDGHLARVVGERVRQQALRLVGHGGRLPAVTAPCQATDFPSRMSRM